MHALGEEVSLKDWPFFMVDGKEHCDVETALSELLADKIVFANSRKYVCLDGSHQGPTIVLFVNCSDLFHYACADAESLSYDQVGPLYKAWKSGTWGVSRWACLQRGERPLRRIEQRMRDDGVWDDALEALPAREVPPPISDAEGAKQ